MSGLCLLLFIFVPCRNIDCCAPQALLELVLQPAATCNFLLKSALGHPKVVITRGPDGAHFSELFVRFIRTREGALGRTDSMEAVPGHCVVSSREERAGC